MPHFQRKYSDLIHEITSKWVNWDPPIPIQVGSYGSIEPDTGDLSVDGNIYDPDFQIQLDKAGVPIRVADHPPMDAPQEDDFIISTRGAKRLDLHFAPEIDANGLASASIKGQWQFNKKHRDALLIMHKPVIRYLPAQVTIAKLYQAAPLKDTGSWLVTSVHTCPAFSMYLSNKSGETISLALVAQAPVAAAAGVTAGVDMGGHWWSDTQADLLRKACDKSGKYSYTPLYTLKRPKHDFFSMKRFRSRAPQAVPKEGEDVLEDAPAPWQPLDEDGDIDAVEVDGEEDADEI